MVDVTFEPDPVAFESGIRRLIAAVDEEFVPPLTAPERHAVTESGSETSGGTVDDYVERCLDRPLVAATADGRLVGMASVRPMSDADALAGYTPTNHVSVIVVDPEFRGRGVGSGLYRTLLSEVPPDYREPNASTKTWSTNDAHTTVLDSFDFECVTRIPDDRGEGVDTVYYARSVEY